MVCSNSYSYRLLFHKFMYLSNGGRHTLLDVQVHYWKDCEAD